MILRHLAEGLAVDPARSLAELPGSPLTPVRRLRGRKEGTVEVEANVISKLSRRPIQITQYRGPDPVAHRRPANRAQGDFWHTLGHFTDCRTDERRPEKQWRGA